MKNINCTDSLLNDDHKIFFSKLMKVLENNPLDENTQESIINSYEEYKKNRYNLEKLIPIKYTTNISDEEWKNIYKRLRQRLHTKWKKILGETNMPSRCPSCGISAPNQMEHYLPRKKFKEFSLFPLNLVPWCGECNSKKGDNFTNSNGIRLFLNFYWDEIDKYSFWECNVDFIKKTIIYSTIKPSSCPDSLYRIVINHVEKLDLQKRYLKPATQAMTYYADTTADNAKTLSKKSIQILLENTVKSFSKYQGNNHWETILYKGFLNAINDENQWEYIITANWER